MLAVSLFDFLLASGCRRVEYVVDEMDAEVVIAGEAVPVHGPELGWEPGPDPELDPPPLFWAHLVVSERIFDCVHAVGVRLCEKSCECFCSLLFCFFFSFLGIILVGGFAEVNPI